jgi:hypothetical protein
MKEPHQMIKNKPAVLKALSKIKGRIQGLLEKCGGPGGTPGPCATAGDKSKAAHTASSHAALMSHQAPGMEGRSASSRAVDAANHAMKQKPGKAAAKAHLAAADLHTKASAAHAAFKGAGKRENTKAAEFHARAAAAHKEAAAAHHS